MTRYKATISYDGYAFAGFQRQPHARSVQEEIEKTLTRLNKGQAITVHGAVGLIVESMLWDRSFILICPIKWMRKNFALLWIPSLLKILM